MIYIPQEDKIHIFEPPCNFHFIIVSMQKAVNNIIDIFSSEDMENMSLVIYIYIYYRIYIYIYIYI